VDKVAAIDASRPLIVTISDGVNEWTLGDTVLVGEVTRRYLGPPEPSPPPVEPESEPPVILQCDPRWADEIYAPTGRLTICAAGCLITCATSLAHWCGYGVMSPALFADRIGEAGAFSGDLLQYPSKVAEAFPDLKWHGRDDPVFYSPRYDIYETSLIDWRDRPVDMELLLDLLELFPVILEVDYDPLDSDVDQHFVLALPHGYIPSRDGINDDLAIMDPMSGHTTVVTYFNPDWVNDWMVKHDVTKVARTVTGARVYDVR
jgi:hypothetical protein